MPLLFVNHHYFRENRYESGIYPTSLKDLHSEVNVLLQRGWRLVSPPEVLHMITSGESVNERVCCLTFDDGFKEQLDVLDALEPYGVYPFFFIPTEVLSALDVLDVHKLQLTRAAVSDSQLVNILEAQLGLRSRLTTEHVNLAAAQYRYDSPPAAELKYFLNFVVDESERQQWLDDVFVEYLGPGASYTQGLYMSVDDVEHLGRLGLVGSHSRSHRSLAQLGDDDLRRELLGSQNDLRNITQSGVWAVSYPYGGPSAVTERVIDAAVQAGYLAGLTMARGINGGEEPLSPMQLRRIDTNDVLAFA